jgi:hypothetical protein
MREGRTERRPVGVLTESSWAEAERARKRREKRATSAFANMVVVGVFRECCGWFRRICGLFRDELGERKRKLGGRSVVV